MANAPAVLVETGLQRIDSRVRRCIVWRSRKRDQGIVIRREGVAFDAEPRLGVRVIELE